MITRMVVFPIDPNSSRDRAVEVARTARVLVGKGKKVSKPEVALVPIRLDPRTLSFVKVRNVASIATQDKRVKIPLVWHKQAKLYKEWFCKAGEIVLNKQGKWVLRLIFEKEPKKHLRTKRVFGVDRGIRRPIVLSNNKFYGKTWWKENERKLLLQVSRLQSKGPKSAIKHLKKVFHRLKRFRENCDRIIAKEIIASTQPGDPIVIEPLTNIREQCGIKGRARKKHRAKMGRWSFNRLENSIKYNAELHGIYVEYVDAHYTSQTCSSFGLIDKKNRKSQSLYSCSCGLTLNADLNAARNIAKKLCFANGLASGLPVNQPIVTNSPGFSYKPPTSVGCC